MAEVLETIAVDLELVAKAATDEGLRTLATELLAQGISKATLAHASHPGGEQSITLVPYGALEKIGNGSTQWTGGGAGGATPSPPSGGGAVWPQPGSPVGAPATAASMPGMGAPSSDPVEAAGQLGALVNASSYDDNDNEVEGQSSLAGYGSQSGNQSGDVTQASTDTQNPDPQWAPAGGGDAAQYQNECMASQDMQTMFNNGQIPMDANDQQITQILQNYADTAAAAGFGGPGMLAAVARALP